MTTTNMSAVDFLTLLMTEAKLKGSAALKIEETELLRQCFIDLQERLSAAEAKPSSAVPYAYVDDEGRLVKISGQVYFDGGFVDADKAPASWSALFKHAPDADESDLYYEAHITIEPVFDERREKAALIAADSGFRLAELLMKKRDVDTEERSSKDTFMTGHSKSRKDIELRTKMAVQTLIANDFKVWRYKIEDTLLDSRTMDVFGLLKVEPEWIEIPAFLRRGD